MTIKGYVSNKYSGGITGTSIIEEYLCSGRLPADNAILSSMAAEYAAKNVSNGGNFVTFEKTIKGTNIKMSEKIRKVRDIRRDCSLEEFKKFEDLGKGNDWTDEQMGIIFHTLIENDAMRYKLTSNSYITLREELMKILYPPSESRLLINRLDTIKQKTYCGIMEYHQEVEKMVGIYSYVNKLTKVETERRMSEVFYKGLGRCTAIEILKQNLDQSNLTDVLTYLTKLEDGILLKAYLWKI